MLLINSQEMPSPAKLTVEITPQTSAVERNLLGTAVMDFLGEKRTIAMRWNYLSQEKLDRLFSAVEGGFFTVTYPDAVGGTRTISCYLGEKSAGIKMIRNGEPLWFDVEMKLIER